MSVNNRFEITLTWEARAYVWNVMWEPDKQYTVAESQGYCLIQSTALRCCRMLNYVRKYKTWSIIGCLCYDLFKLGHSPSSAHLEYETHLHILGLFQIAH